MSDVRNPESEALFEPPVAPAGMGGTTRWGPSHRASDRAQKLVLFLSMVAACAIIGFHFVYFPPLFVFGAVVGIGSVVAILGRPYLGLLLYTVLFVVRPAEMYPELSPLRLERIVGTVTLVAMCFDMYRRNGMIFIDGTRQTKLLFVLVAVMYLTVPFSFWPGRSLNVIGEFLKTAGFYVMVIQLIQTRKQLRVFTLLFLALILFVAVTSLRAFFAGEFMFAQGIERAVGTTSSGGDPNSLGATLGSAIPIALLAASAFPNVWSKFLFWIGSGLTLWTVSMTGSRSSLVGLLSAGVVLWFLSRRKLFVGFVGAMALVLGFFALPESYKERYTSITSPELDQSSQLRVAGWKAGGRMILDRPFLGVGVGAFGTAHATGYSGGNWLNAHSLYVQVPAELGIVGAVVYFAFLIGIFRLNRRARNEIKASRPGWRFEIALLDGILASLVLLCAYSIFAHSMLRYTWFLFSALSLATYRLHRDLPRGDESRPEAG